MELKNKLIILIISLYIIAGNLPRFISIHGFRDNVLITEIILFATLLLYGLFTKKIFNSLIKFSIIYIVIIYSFLYGVLINGFEIKPLLYSVRLILIILCANVAGYLLFHVFRTNIKRTFKYILNNYLVVLIISAFIYIVFPNSFEFWRFLSQYGIMFHGDPHIHRLVSTYLDPNYYSVIAIIPLVISLYLFSVTREKKQLMFILLIMSSIFLTGSRSGIVAMLLLFTAILFRHVVIANSFTKTGVRAVLIISVLSLVASPLYISNITRMLIRLSNILVDPSALHRLHSFIMGLELVFERPLFGIGYNYLSSHIESSGGHLSSVDSSLLSMIINFGSIASFIIISLFILWLIIIFKRSKYADRDFITFLQNFIVYIFIVMFFAANFNNLLFYQFWLFPIIMIGTYLTKYLREVKHEYYNN
jgi:O-antigen ligase